MNEKLNLVEILKYCPSGTKLYSTVFGYVEFEHVNISANHPIVIRLKDGTRKSFTTEGKLYITYDGECTLFPSKNQRDWSKFNPKKEGFITSCEFKDGDIVATNSGLQVFILQRQKSDKEGYFYIGYDFGLNDIFHAGECKFNRLSTEEEKQKLFDAIKKRGYKWNKVYPATKEQSDALMKAMNDSRYKWNAETKTLEKLVEPKFKVGDEIVNGYMKYMGAPGTQRTILKITDDKYIFTDGSRMSISCQDSWDLLSDMLEPKTLDDDRIKTAIRNHLLEMWEHCQNNVYGVHVADAIAWLKKQGESDKNPNSKTIDEYLYKEKGYPISLKDVQNYNAYKEKRLIEIACKWLREQKEMIGISFQEDFIERFKMEMKKYTN